PDVSRIRAPCKRLAEGRKLSACVDQRLARGEHGTIDASRCGRGVRDASGYPDADENRGGRQGPRNDLEVCAPIGAHRRMAHRNGPKLFRRRRCSPECLDPAAPGRSAAEGYREIVSLHGERSTWYGSRLIWPTDPRCLQPGSSWRQKKAIVSIGTSRL